MRKPNASSGPCRICLNLVMCSFVALSILSTRDAKAAGVQHGTAVSSGNGTVTVAITSVDTTKAFLIFQSRHNGNRPTGSEIRGRIASPTTIEFVRVTDGVAPEPVTINIQWYVVEFASGVKVQHGVRVQDSLTVNIPLTAVASLKQAFVTWSKSPATTDQTWDANDPIVGELTTTSNLQFRSGGTLAAHTVSWQVIEFTDPAAINVQKGSTSMTGGTLSVNATLGTPVNVNRTFVLVGFQASGSGADVGARMLRAQLLDSVTIAIDRSISGTSDITEIVWQAVELKDGTTVQRGTENFAAGIAQKIVSISPVDLTRSIAFASVQPAGGQNMGSSPYATDDVIGVGCATMALSSNQITMDRNNTADQADIGWFVVQFSGTTVPIQLSSFAAHAAKAARTVILDWTTLTETNNYGFEVERKASGQLEFITLPNSFIAGHGTTLQPQQYSFTDASVTAGQWSYRLKQIDLDGTVHFTDPVQVVVLTDVKEKSLPTKFALEQNYPNPFNPETVISYQLPVVSGQSSVVNLKVYDLLGREVAVVVNERQAPGSYSVRFNASGLASGAYLYRLTAGTFREAKTLMLMK